VDIKKFYAQFNVLPDSFDIYITARRFFNDAEMLSGWVPQPEGWQYTSWITGGIELGPPQEKTLGGRCILSIVTLQGLDAVCREFFRAG
jgi:hypothetical protein